MSMIYLGEAAAVGTALLWTLSAIAWSHAGQRIGSNAVTAVRSLLAVLLLAAIHWLAYGTLLPRGGDAATMFWLALSGVTGFGIGDLCFFHALKLIGPRVGMTVLCTSPLLTALLAALPPLRETPGPIVWAGIAVTIIGMLVVVLEEPGEKAWQQDRRQGLRGVMWAALGSALFSVGFVLSRMGVGDHLAAPVTPLSATLVRVLFGTISIWLLLPLFGTLGGTLRSFRDRRSMTIIVAGTVVGPVIGIWLSMMAFQKAETGVATALISTGPIFMLMLSHWSHGERPTLRAVCGVLLAVAGVTMLVLRNSMPGS